MLTHCIAAVQMTLIGDRLELLIVLVLIGWTWSIAAKVNVSVNILLLILLEIMMLLTLNLSIVYDSLLLLINNFLLQFSFSTKSVENWRLS